MDATMLSGSFQYCECTLTTSNNSGSENVAYVDVIYAKTTNRIKFSVDNITYTNTSRYKQHKFAGDSIRVVVEKTYTGEKELRTGNPCIVFEVQENGNTTLTLSCLPGTDVDPRKTELITSITHAKMEKSTIQVQRTTHPTITAPSKRHSDVHDTSYITTSSTSKDTESVKVTTSKEIITTSTSTTTGSVNVSTNELEQGPTTLYEMETTISAIQDVTTGSNELQKNVSAESGGSETVITVIVVVAVVCIAIIIVLITCYCRRRKRSPIKADEHTIKPRKKDDYDVTENEMYVPLELLNEQNYTQDSTDHVYDQPDVDIIAVRANGNETKPLLQGQVASVVENNVKVTVDQSAWDDANSNAIANSEKNNQENQNHIQKGQTGQLYTQVDKIKSNINTSVSTEHIYDVSG